MKTFITVSMTEKEVDSEKTQENMEKLDDIIFAALVLMEKHLVQLKITNLHLKREDN